MNDYAHKDRQKFISAHKETHERLEQKQKAALEKLKLDGKHIFQRIGWTSAPIILGNKK